MKNSEKKKKGTDNTWFFADFTETYVKRDLYEIKPARMRSLNVVLCSEEQVLVDAVWEREPVVILTRRETWDTLSDPVTIQLHIARLSGLSSFL